MTLVLPYAAGGPVDVVGRIMAPRMSEILGRQVVIENVVGAGGVTGVLRVRKAPPDGYQFVLSAAGTFAHSQTLFKNPPYNPSTDFASIGLIAEAPPILITRKDLPARDLKEFIASCQGEPEQDAVRLRRRRVGRAHHLPAPECRHRRQDHARALSRHRAGLSGPDRGPRTTTCATTSRARCRISRATRSRRSRR